jgi:hypothetical protein
MVFRLLSFLIAASALCASAAEQISALSASQALSKAQQRSIARLSARAGKPSPEAWTIVVFDPKAAKGVRELTVASGTILSSRMKSDIALKLTKSDVIGFEGLRIDSDQVAELTASYASTNQLVPAAFDYDLRKEGEDAAPLWTVVAYDESGARLGTIVVAANSGAIISHEGFVQEPQERDLTGEVATADHVAEEATDPEKSSEPDTSEKPAAKSSGSKKKTASSSSSSSSSSGSPERHIPRTFRRVGGHLQKFFTGKNTIGR